MDYGRLPGRYPAIVRSYSAATRTCRIEIPGLTDGADVLPEADIEYPIGFRSVGDHTTEIEILPGDFVWVAFIGGDARYPVITGARVPQSGNANAWRRVHHENLEFLADTLINVEAGGDITIKTGATVKVEAMADVSVTAAGNATVEAAQVAVTAAGAVSVKAAQVGVTAEQVAITASAATLSAATTTCTGDLSVTGNVAVAGSVVAAGNVMAGTVSLMTHTHTEQGDGNPVSPPM